MNAKEFIKIAYNGGYALKKNAQKYTEKYPKKSYTVQDFVNVYRFHEKKKRQPHCIMSTIRNGKTTAFRNGILNDD